MVRRSGVASYDSGPEPTAYAGDSPTAGKRDGSPAKPPWRGGGGRWTVWPLRVLLWAAIIVIGYRGVMAIVLNETPSPASGTPAVTSSPAPQFPITLGEAYALEFGQVYLNFNPASANQRQRQLAAFVPSSVSELQPQLGWNGEGSLHLQSEQVANVDVRSATNAIVTLLATVNGRMIELGVPVYSSGGSMVVSGLPAWMPAPPTAQLPSTQQPSPDLNAQNQLMSQLPTFFQAYASSDQATLNRFLQPGVSISGLGGTVNFGSIASIAVPRGGATRHITVTVNWLLPSQVRGHVAQFSATYDMTVVDQQSGKWYVKEIRASTQPMGTQ